MDLQKVKKLFWDLTKQYFSGASVIYSNQSRVTKPSIPLVTLAFGQVERPSTPDYMVVDGVLMGKYLSSVEVNVDLFTHGEPVLDDDTGEMIGVDDTAVSDLLKYVNFLNSEYSVEWQDVKSITISVDNTPQNLSGLINETTYEYRARIRVLLYFVETAIEYTANLSEHSVVYPTGEVDGETGEPIFSSEIPVRRTSTTGGFGSPEEEREKAVKVKPDFKPTASGGGNQDLANLETGYYEEAEITVEEDLEL